MPALRIELLLGRFWNDSRKLPYGYTVRRPHAHRKPFPGREILGLGGSCRHPGGLASYNYGRCLLKHAVSRAPASTFTFTAAAEL